MPSPVDKETFLTVRKLIAAIQHGFETRPNAATQHVVSRLAEQHMREADFVTQKAKSLPVLSQFAACLTDVHHFEPSLALHLHQVQPLLKWQQSASYTDAVLGDGFTENYGWAQLIGPHGFFHGDDFLLGVLMLGPHRHYRDHNHPAPELYWPLTSGSHWRCTPDDFVEKSAGDIIWHEPFQIHATKTFEQPMLAVWAWTKNVATPARLV